MTDEKEDLSSTPLLKKEENDKIQNQPEVSANDKKVDTNNATSTSISSLEDLDAPLTMKEKIKLLCLALFTPWILYLPLIYFGAYIWSYPSRPETFRGLWLAPVTFSIAYIISMSRSLDCPRVIRERVRKDLFRGKKPDQPYKEKIAQRLYLISFIIGFMVCGYEAAAAAAAGTTNNALNDGDDNSGGGGRSRNPTCPDKIIVTTTLFGTPLQFSILDVMNCIGIVFTVLSLIWIGDVIRANKYASKVVYKQEEQHIVKRGPYSRFRHPMYAYMIFFTLGMPLVIGSLSYWGLLFMSIITNLISMWRTFHEEEFLVQQFGQEYEEYRKEVPTKMIPYIF